MRKLQKKTIEIQGPVKVACIRQNVALVSRVIFAKLAIDKVMNEWVVEQPVFKVEEDGPDAGCISRDENGKEIVIGTEKSYKDHRITGEELKMLDTQVRDFINELYELIVEQENED